MGSHRKPARSSGGKKVSPLVAAHRARREAGGTVEAIRSADPNTVKGLAAQKAGLGVVAVWGRKHDLLPLTGGAVTMAAGGLSPGLTAAALAVTAGCQEVARRRGAGAWSPEERTAAGAWAAAAAAWSGAQLVVPGMPLWQWAAGLVASVALPSVMWRRASSAAPEEAPQAEQSIWELALLTVLGEMGAEGGALAGARLLAAPEQPAPQVVSVLIGLGYSVHADDIVSSGILQRAMEARLQIPTRGGLQIERVDNTTLRITASWSQALSQGDVEWELKGQPGQSWLGLDDARKDILLETWKPQKGGKTRVYHGWVVGRTGSGKSTTLVNLLLPDQARGWQMLLVADGAGDSLNALEPYATRYARYETERWEQVIALAHQIMMSRRRRGWPGPSPSDPIIRLVMDEATTLKLNIDPIAQKQVGEIGRLGERFGVSSIQGLQNPVIEELIGEGKWRAQTRWVIGHASQDPTYSHIASASSSEQISLLGLEVGRAGVLSQGQVLARRGKMAWADQERIDQVMRGVEQPTLHPADMAWVKELWEATEGWPSYEEESELDPDAPMDKSGLRMSRWTKTPIAMPAGVPAGPGALPLQPEPGAPITAAAPSGKRSLVSKSGFSMGGRLRLVPTAEEGPAASAALPAAAGAPVVSPAEYSDAKEWMVLYLRRVGPQTGAQMAATEVYSRSTVFDTARALVANGTLAKEGDQYRVQIVGNSQPTQPAPAYGTPSPYAQAQP